jgi:hypothetical protein
LNLARIGPATDHEVVGEGGRLAHIKRDNVASLLGFGGADGGKPERFRLG